MNLSPDQRAAFRQALHASGIDEDEFVELAIRMLAARYGVVIPPRPPSPVKPYPRKSAGGRPPKAADGQHIMERDVPVGDFARVCPVCRRNFRVDDEAIVYCSLTCEKSAENRRNYVKRKSS